VEAGRDFSVCADFTSPGCLASTLSLRGKTPAQAAGLRYEQKVVRFLEKRFQLIPQLPFEFQAAAKPSRNRSFKLIPDVILFHPGGFECVVVEVKHQHSGKACVQLERYRCAVERAWPWMRVGTLEVCANYYTQELTVKVFLLDELSQVWNLSAFAHDVYVLSGRELKLALGMGNGLRVGDELCGAPLW